MPEDSSCFDAADGEDEPALEDAYALEDADAMDHGSDHERQVALALGVTKGEDLGSPSLKSGLTEDLAKMSLETPSASKGIVFDISDSPVTRKVEPKRRDAIQARMQQLR